MFSVEYRTHYKSKSLTFTTFFGDSEQINKVSLVMRNLFVVFIAFFCASKKTSDTYYL